MSRASEPAARSTRAGRGLWEALPAVGAALVEHGPDLIDSFVPGEALLQRLEGFPAPAGPVRLQGRLREIVARARVRRPNSTTRPVRPGNPGAPHHLRKSTLNPGDR